MLLNQFLLLAAVLFCLGVYGVLTRRNGVMVLMSVELILNAVNINLVAFGAFQDNIQGFLEKLKTRYQLFAKLPKARSNVTKTRKSVDSLSKEEIAGISKNNALDIELFDRLKESLGDL